MAAKLSTEERSRLKDLHAEGRGRNEIARDLDRSPGIVSKVAAQMGLAFDRSHTKKATAVKAEWDKERRVDLVGKGMAHAETMLPEIADAGELQKWMVAVATGVDKLRLEGGEATERKENVDPSRRERTRAALDEVAAKRRERLG